MKSVMTNRFVKWIACIGAATICVIPAVIGCADDDNRKPTAAEGAAADKKRQAAIDAMPGLSPEQKAMAKSRMGGPQVAMPGDDKKAAAANKGRN